MEAHAEYAKVTCQSCQETRDRIMKAWQDRQIAEAVRLAAGGLRDIVKGKGGNEKR